LCGIKANVQPSSKGAGIRGMPGSIGREISSSGGTHRQPPIDVQKKPTYRRALPPGGGQILDYCVRQESARVSIIDPHLYRLPSEGKEDQNQKTQQDKKA